MPQYNGPFTSNPETIQVADKQVLEDHINGLPVRLFNASGAAIGVAASPMRVDPTGTTTQPVSAGGSSTAAIASANLLTVVKNSAGRLYKIVVTATGAGGPVNIYDNATAASGTIIGVVPASAAVGTVYDLQMPAANGITVGAGPASSPAFTLSYS